MLKPSSLSKAFSRTRFVSVPLQHTVGCKNTTAFPHKVVQFIQSLIKENYKDILDT